ncbi:MAG: hypothetical protein ACREQ9_11850 [Candidatus Binatia bacterium]
MTETVPEAAEPGVGLAEDLRLAEERLRMVVGNAPVVLWAFDRHGVFTLLEGLGLRALGPRARAVIGRSVFEVYGDLPEVVEASRRVLAGEEFVAVQEVDGVVFVGVTAGAATRGPA